MEADLLSPVLEQFGSYKHGNGNPYVKLEKERFGLPILLWSDYMELFRDEEN